MPVPTLHRFTVQEYYRMADVGVLKWDEHDELLNGVVMAPFRMSPLRACILHEIAKPFFHLPKESCIVSIRNPVRLDEYNELQPDVALLRYLPDYYAERHPGPGDVLLLIEVADHSLAYVREKIPVYARTGIAEAWIVNLMEQTIEIYRESNLDGYATKMILRAGDSAKPQTFSNVLVDVAELLKR